MKKIIIPALAAGFTLFVIGIGLNQFFSFIFSLQSEYMNSGVFRPWSDPLMSLIFIYPFVVGFIMAAVWMKVRSLFRSKKYHIRGFHYGLVYWGVTALPGMLISYSNFKISLLMTATWTISALVQYCFAGIVLAKLQK